MAKILSFESLRMAIGVNPLKKLLESFLSQPKFNLITVFAIALIIPLTVVLTQRQQEIRSKALGKSKLGIQTQWQKPGEMEFIETALPIVVKLMDGYDKATTVKEKSPGSFIVGRIWEQNQPIDGTPETRAQEWFTRNKTNLLKSGFDCWEGYNEPFTNSAEVMQWYSRFEIKRMQLLESIGKKACIGNFSVANPDYYLWQYFKEAVSYATLHGHYLSLHEYGPTRMDDRFEDFSLRHRRVYQENSFTLPLVITETGIDENGNPDTGGWRTHASAYDYLSQLKWYDAELQKDTYVKGAAIFSYGLYGWQSFEIYPELPGLDGRSGPLTSYIRGGPAPTATPSPTPTCNLTAPTNLTVASATKSSATLKWTPGTGGAAQLLRLATTELGATSGCNSAPCLIREDHLSPTASSYTTAKILSPGTTYWWRIVNANGSCSVKDALASFTLADTSSITGLRGEYFKDTTLTNLGQTNYGDIINYNWGSGSPITGVIPIDNFSIRWKGYITPPTTGTYIFYTTTDDGVNLWINNQLLIKAWKYQSPTEYSVSVNLTAGVRYPIRMDYFEGTGGAVAQLRWSGPNIAKQIIKTDYFTPN